MPWRMAKWAVARWYPRVVGVDTRDSFEHSRSITLSVSCWPHQTNQLHVSWRQISLVDTAYFVWTFAKPSPPLRPLGNLPVFEAFTDLRRISALRWHLRHCWKKHCSAAFLPNQTKNMTRSFVTKTQWTTLLEQSWRWNSYGQCMLLCSFAKK